jgi:hypothetical protein
MKNILFTILLLVSLASFGQKKREGTGLVDYLSDKLGKNVTFVSYEKKNGLN